MNISDWCLNKEASLKQAMTLLEAKKEKILFIVDEKSALLGSLTDGDVRRFFIKGGNVDDKVIDAANHNPHRSFCVEEAVKEATKNALYAIPIVRESGEVIDVYCVHSSGTSNRRKLNVPVVINAGGKGQRLEPFTRVLPKPLIPVGDIPIIEHIMQQYMFFGCDDFHVIVNYKKDLMKAYFSESETAYNLIWHDEEIPLGTGGGLSLLKGKMKETFFFTNCDILLKSDYESILAFHKKNHNVVTIVCANKHLVVPYGVIEIDAQNSIVEMKEKPELSYLVNTGVYVVEPEVIDEMEYNAYADFPDVIEKIRRAGKKVSVYSVDESEWLDMGQIPELEKMRTKLYGE